MQLAARARRQGLGISSEGIAETTEFPGLELNGLDLEQFLNKKLLPLGISLKLIEEAYPCTLMQQGIFVSHSENPHLYVVRSLGKLDVSVDLSRP
jgi:hypothetical protein